MCDQDHFEDDVKEYTARGAVTRRELGALALGGMMFLLPRTANAAAVTETDVKIKTPDGVCDAYFVHPASGAAAGVVMWPDIMGLRPAFRQMGKRLAESGYSVLVVNPFYRQQAAPVVAAGASFSDPAVRNTVMALMKSLSPATVGTDAKAFVGFLDSQAAVDKRKKIGVMGYCMSGPYTIRTMATNPDRVAAGASFHGGGLVTKTPDSPHLLSTKGQFLFAIAESDDKTDPDAKTVLKDTFKTSAEVEVYPAAHGWTVPDSAAYNEPQAEKAWSRMLALFGKQLA